jgi:hypothetical protein
VALADYLRERDGWVRAAGQATCVASMSVIEFPWGVDRKTETHQLRLALVVPTDTIGGFWREVESKTWLGQFGRFTSTTDALWQVLRLERWGVS